MEEAQAEAAAEEEEEEEEERGGEGRERMWDTFAGREKKYFGMRGGRNKKKGALREASGGVGCAARSRFQCVVRGGRQHVAAARCRAEPARREERRASAGRGGGRRGGRSQGREDWSYCKKKRKEKRKKEERGERSPPPDGHPGNQ